jgi:tetratricopeptide (TPR) repeat protein
MNTSGDFDRDGIGAATRLVDLAGLACDEGRPGNALVYLRRALAVCRAAGDRIGELRTLDSLAELAMCDLDESPAVYYEQQLPIYRELGDGAGEATSLEVLGHAAHCDGRYEEAVTYLRAALAMYRASGDAVLEASVLEDLSQFRPGRGPSD